MWWMGWVSVGGEGLGGGEMGDGAVGGVGWGDGEVGRWVGEVVAADNVVEMS